MANDPPFIETRVALFDSLGIDIAKEFVFVNEHEITWERDRDLQNLQNLVHASGKRLILAFDTNPTTMFDTTHTRQYLLDLIAEIGDRVLLMSHNLKHFFEPCQQIYFPYFMLQQQLEIDYQSSKKNYRMSFLSNQPRFHRVWFYQQVKNHITDLDCFVVHADKDESPDQNFILSYCRYYLGRDIDLMQDLPFIQDHGRDRFSDSLPYARADVDWSNRHPAYSAVYNITGESISEDEQIFFTEKTWKSLRSRCLTINLGSRYANQYLQQLGFLTDHDLDLPLLDKIQWIRDLMQNTTLADAFEAQACYQDLIEHNISRFYSSNLKKIFVNYLRDRLRI